MINSSSSSSQAIQNFLRFAAGWVPGSATEETQLAPAIVDQKAPPRQSLRRTFVEGAARRTEPSASWFQGA